MKTPAHTTPSPAQPEGTPVHRARADAAGTPVSAIMSRDVVTLPANASVDDATDFLFDRDLHRVPVLNDEGVPVGIVARTDLLAHLRRAARQHTSNGKAQVTDVMTRFPLRLRNDATVAEAAEMMALQRVHGVPVVSGDGKLVGMVSALDVLGWLAGLE